MQPETLEAVVAAPDLEGAAVPVAPDGWAA